MARNMYTIHSVIFRNPTPSTEDIWVGGMCVCWGGGGGTVNCKLECHEGLVYWSKSQRGFRMLTTFTHLSAVEPFAFKPFVYI